MLIVCSLVLVAIVLTMGVALVAPGMELKLVNFCVNEELRQLQPGDYDMLYKSHLNTIVALIRSDVQVKSKDEEDRSLKPFPASYTQALHTIDDILAHLDSQNHKLLSSCKLIRKKEGLPRDLPGLEHSRFMTRDIIEIKRRTERVLSEILLLMMSHRICMEMNHDADLLHFVKPVLELVSAQDRHMALITLCKGLLAPNYPSSTATDVSSLIRNPRPSLLSSYRECMQLTGRSQLSINARLLFPLFATCLRCHTYVNQGGVSETVRALYLPEDLRVSQFLARCMELDESASSLSPAVLPGAIGDMLLSLHRWINDLIALHFINTNINSQQLPDEIQRNTVAMEIFSTLPALSEGRKRDRDAYFACMAELGRFVDIIVSLIDTPHHLAGLLRDVRVVMATTSTMRSLSDSSRLKNKLQWRLGVLQREKISALKISPRGTKNEVPESALWPTTSFRPKGSRYVARKVVKVTDPLISSNSNSERGIVSPSSEGSPASPMKEVDAHFLELLSDTLKVDLSQVYKSEVLVEIEHVLTSWRRPQLLLDYYRIHASSPEVQNTYRRFLRALFAVSNETVEAVRFEDPLNRAHLDRFPPKLLEAWREGRVITQGRMHLLPGFNDPQALFMLGEDAHTCMSVRAKQKGSNRGLLGFLLHGCYRVLGVRNSAGGLVAQAVAQLLVDDASHSPVIYVHGPQGDQDHMLEIYDSAAELGRRLEVPVIYAVTPPADEYILSEGEIIAHGGDSRHMNISDYSCLSPFVWLEGVKAPGESCYLPDRPPSLVKSNPANMQTTAGIRPEGSIETCPFFGKWQLIEVPLPEDSVVRVLQTERVENLRRRQDSLQGRDDERPTAFKLANMPGSNKASVQARLADRQRWITANQLRGRDGSTASRDAPALAEMKSRISRNEAEEEDEL